MRIFIGLTDVANITANYAKGFKALGHKVFSVVWNKSRFYSHSEYNLVIDNRGHDLKSMNARFAPLRIATQMTKLVGGVNCDLFILFAPAVLPTYIYYPLLKFLGKKIITAFWGSDIRHWYAFAEEMKYYGVQDEVSPFIAYARDRSGGSYLDKQRTVMVAEKYSDLIISQPDCGQLQSRSYMRCNIPLDLSEYTFNVPGRLKPLILHAPSVPEAKGTNIVLSVIQELRDEGLEFDFHFIENMPNTQLRNLLSVSDIVVDELYSATVGGLSSEAMATGNVVLVRYMSEYCKVPPGCPAINVNKFTLKNNLREMIVNIPRRIELAQIGRAYVEKVNDHVRVCEELLDWLAGRDDLEYDFVPTFWQKFQLPEHIRDTEKRETRRRRLDFYKSLLSTSNIKERQN